MLELLPDQIELIDGVRDKLRSGSKSVMIQASTGSGKTYVASSIVKGAYSKGKTAIFVVPRRDLLRQTSATFEKFGIPHGFIAAGKYYDPRCQIHIASKDTLKSRLDIIKKYDLAVFDEAHYGGVGLNDIVQHFKPHSTLIGLSATPTDMAGKGLAHQYESLVCGKSTRWLIDNKRLSEYRAFAPNHLDLSQIGMVGGDYNKTQLSAKMESDIQLMGNVVKHYKQHAMGRLGVTFCVRRKHSEMMAQSFRDNGVPAVHMDGETPEEVRIKIAKAFARREILQICNAELLCFGYDLSSISGMDSCIEVMSDCQPTRSTAKQLQKFGRVLRYDGTTHDIFDHANNFEAHGLPCDEREWTLEGKKKRKRNSDDERTIPVKTCSRCYFSHHPKPICPNCGYVYPVQERTIEEIDIELKEIELRKEVESKKKARMKQGQAKTIADLKAIADEKGYKYAWVIRMAKIKGIKS